mgnify:CR=1 FL=1
MSKNIVNRCGRPYKTNNVDKKFRYIRKCISEIYPDDDFTDITPHYLRHTFATVGVNAGVPLKSMQALLGHADTKTLLDTYMHICYEDKRSSIKMIENNTSVKSLPAVDDTLSEKDQGNFISARGVQDHLQIWLGDRVLYRYKENKFQKNKQMKGKIWADVCLPEKTGEKTLFYV